MAGSYMCNAIKSWSQAHITVWCILFLQGTIIALLIPISLPWGGDRRGIRLTVELKLTGNKLEIEYKVFH